MSTLRFWSRNIRLRLDMLKGAIPDWSDTMACDLAGWSIQRHGQVQNAESLTTKAMEKMARSLRCPVSALLAEDPARIVGHEINPSDWIGEDDE